MPIPVITCIPVISFMADIPSIMQGGAKLLGFFIEIGAYGIWDYICNIIFQPKPATLFPSYNIISSVIYIPVFNDINPKIFFQLRDG